VAEDTADRTERATPRRLEEARKQGQVPMSPEVAPVAVLLAAVGLVSWGAPRALEQGRSLLAAWLGALGGAVRDEPVWPLLGRTAIDAGAVFLPFALATGAVGAAAVAAQVGLAVRPQLLAPKASRLDPAAGLRRIFSANGAVNLLKAVVKIAVVLALAYRVLRHTGAEAVGAPDLGVDALLGFAGLGLRRLFVTMAVALALLGVLDWLWQRRRHEQSLRMSRREVRDEQKEAEGDPHVRMRFRRAHREIAKRRMLAEVRRADVVLTNPVHLAVALRYRAEEAAAPTVLAKGAGEVAQRIKDAARRAGVPIVERRALARLLYRRVPVGGQIPPALYRAVAEILAYIYALRAPAPAEAR
jgi:flagellar biosynthetic protein FlhB